FTYVNGTRDSKRNGNNERDECDHDRADQQRNNSIPILPKTCCDPVRTEQERRYGAVSRNWFFRAPRPKFFQCDGKLLQILLRLDFPLYEGSARFRVRELRWFGEETFNLALHRLLDLREHSLGRPERSHSRNWIDRRGRTCSFVFIIGGRTRRVAAGADERPSRRRGLVPPHRRRGE